MVALADFGFDNCLSLVRRAYSFLKKQAFRLFEKHLPVFLVKTIEAGAKYETYFDIFLSQCPHSI